SGREMRTIGRLDIALQPCLVLKWSLFLFSFDMCIHVNKMSTQCHEFVTNLHPWRRNRMRGTRCVALMVMGICVFVLGSNVVQGQSSAQRKSLVNIDAQGVGAL